MNWKEHIAAALAVVGAAAGFGFATGRVQAVFYAQTAHASWLGIAVSGLFCALLTAMVAHLTHRTGARRFPGIYRRLLGCYAGKWIGGLYAIVLLIGGALQLLAAAKAGALALPMRNAAYFTALIALSLSALVAGMGTDALKRLGGLYLLLLLFFQIALWKWGSVSEARLDFAVDLRLEDSLASAVLLGLMHAALCTALSAGVVVRLSGSRIRAWQLGICCGALFALVCLCGNAALLRQREEILALRSPFAALVSPWGTVGFYICTTLVFLGAVVTLSGILISLLGSGFGRNMPEN